MSKRKYRGRRLTRTEQLGHPCPTCHAPAGEHCRNWRGLAMHPHGERGYQEEKRRVQLRLFDPNVEGGP